MYWKVLDKNRQVLLKEIVNLFDIDGYYMAGGTALSLQLGLRESVDFDFFVPQKFNTNSLLHVFKDSFPQLKVLQHDDSTLDLEVNGVQVSFFYYPYMLIEDVVIDDDLPKLPMAGPKDIAAMKVSAIGSRGAKKDFYDLFQICTIFIISPEEMYNILRIKFGSNVDFSYMIMGLSYFEDADKQQLSNVFVQADWKKIKRFFGHYSAEVGNILMMESRKMHEEELKS